jgi:Cupin domain
VAQAGDKLRSPGMTLQIMELDPELLVMEALYDGNGQMPPAHYHPSQVESFTILEGRVRALIDGDERVYDTGDSFDVPAGTTHQMAADGGPARMRWEVRPALRTADFFERLLSGSPGEDFLEEFSAEFRLA